ncbi:MAG: hypothetical protein ACLGXA_18625 [Acidobacteriota bacterium]
MQDVRGFIGEADLRCRRESCEGAIENLEGAAHLEPLNWRIHMRLGLCLSGGCRQHALVSSEAALYHLETALSLLPRSSGREDRAAVLAALGNTLPAAGHLPPKTRAGAAIANLEEAAAIYESLGRFQDWARQHYNLGNIWCELPIQSFRDKWEQAIRHYKEALRIWTTSGDPKRHVRVLQNLGTAWRESEAGNPQWNRCEALRCFHRALQQCRKHHLPENVASLHSNIGNIFLMLHGNGSAKKKRHAQVALAHFNRAIGLLNREAEERVYAIAQFNRGQALLQIAMQESASIRLLCDAHAAFEESQRSFLARGDAMLAERAADQLATVGILVSAEQLHQGTAESGAAAATVAEALSREPAGPLPTS